MHGNVLVPTTTCPFLFIHMDYYGELIKRGYFSGRVFCYIVGREMFYKLKLHSKKKGKEIF